MAVVSSAWTDGTKSNIETCRSAYWGAKFLIFNGIDPSGQIRNPDFVGPAVKAGSAILKIFSAVETLANNVSLCRDQQLFPRTDISWEAHSLCETLRSLQLGGYDKVKAMNGLVSFLEIESEGLPPKVMAAIKNNLNLDIASENGVPKVNASLTLN
jgi:hypothetical protein